MLRPGIILTISRLLRLGPGLLPYLRRVIHLVQLHQNMDHHRELASAVVVAVAAEAVAVLAAVPSADLWTLVQFRRKFCRGRNLNI